MSPPAPLTVLLVEDNAADADLVAEALDDAAAGGGAGSRVALVHVTRLTAALRHMAEQAVDAVLLDLSLPDSQGLATFRSLHERMPGVPLVVLSGLADEEVAARAVHEGAQDYLVKGELSGRLLSRALRYAIERQRAEAERIRLAQREEAAQARAAAAEAALRMRSAFLADAAHELKTPLTALLGSVQLLLRQIERDGVPDPASLVARLRGAERQATRLSRLVAQLLDVADVESGAVRLAPTATDLGALVEASAAMVQGRTSRHRLRVQIAARSVVVVDGRRMEQVLTHLLDNAVTFSPQGGDIAVEVAVPAPGVARVAVRDHGLGIPPERRAQLFAPFFQAHAEAHRSGLGLGLYLSRRLVALHRGTLVAEFPTDGGTRFVIDLPTVSTA